VAPETLVTSRKRRGDVQYAILAKDHQGLLQMKVLQYAHTPTLDVMQHGTDFLSLVEQVKTPKFATCRPEAVVGGVPMEGYRDTNVE
jgi:hypothetical protein